MKAEPITCEKCGKPCAFVEAVQTMKATYSSPQEIEMWGSCCLRDSDYDEEMRSLKGLSNEELERI